MEITLRRAARGADFAAPFGALLFPGFVYVCALGGEGAGTKEARRQIDLLIAGHTAAAAHADCQ